MLTQRHFGLDIVRALAISMVLLQHSNTITKYIPYSLPVFLSKINLPDGVDLFFVLSGFLIGRILLKTDWKHRQSIFAFWKRRLLRTLPNYYLFLAINIVLLYLKISPGLLSHAVLYYFVFLQNFHKPVDVFFWESWSLCIEEWFYFLFPLSLFLLHKISQHKTALFLSTIILFFTFSMGAKLYYINSAQTIDFDLYLRKLAITRFDTLCFGLLLAYVAFSTPTFLKKIKWVGACLFITYMIFGDIPLANNYYIANLMFSALACSGLLIFCLDYERASKLPTVITEFISKISYSMYLVHLPVLYILNVIVSNDYSAMPLIYFISYIFVVSSLSFLNYRYFELYFLKRRDS